MSIALNIEFIVSGAKIPILSLQRWIANMPKRKQQERLSVILSFHP